MRFKSITFIAVALLGGCGPTPLPADQGAVTACESLYEAQLRLCVCGGFNTERDCSTIILGAPGRDCSHVAAIRDEEALYSNCIPALETESCTISGGVANYPFPIACHDQLLF